MDENRGYQGKRLQPKKRAAKFWSDYGYLLVTVAVVFVLFKVVFQLAYVPTGSMETTVPSKSLMVCWRLPYVVSDPVPERGEVVTFWSDEMGKLLVKRVIGLPGDEISFSGGYVYINGERLEEDYLPQQGITTSDGVFQVPDGCLFLLGDNRAGSWDSRSWSQPYIPVSKLQARVLVCASVLKDKRRAIVELALVRQCLFRPNSCRIGSFGIERFAPQTGQVIAALAVFQKSQIVGGLLQRTIAKQDAQTQNIHAQVAFFQLKRIIHLIERIAIVMHLKAILGQQIMGVVSPWHHVYQALRRLRRLGPAVQRRHNARIMRKALGVIGVHFRRFLIIGKRQLGVFLRVKGITATGNHLRQARTTFFRAHGAIGLQGAHHLYQGL